MAPQKMIYVKNEDAQLFEQAMQITKESLSNTIVQALSQLVEYSTIENFEPISLSVGMALETDFEESELVQAEFEKAFEQTYANTDESEIPAFDSSLSDCYEFTWQLFQTENITFYGKHLYSFQNKPENPGDFDVWYGDCSEEKKAILLAENTAVKDIPNLDTDCDYFLKALKQSPQAKNLIYSDDRWFIPDSVDIDLYITRKGQFLITFSPCIDKMHECWLEIPTVAPRITDYAIIKQLKANIKEIKGKTSGCTIMLPPNFMLKAINSLTNQPKNKLLDI